MTAPSCPPNTFTAPWFGRPGAMEVIAKPDTGVSKPGTRGTVLARLISGGQSGARRKNTKRTYTLTWSQQPPAKADTLRAYYTGIMGTGPWCYADPNERNTLDEDTCSMGARGYGTGWVPLGAGTATRDTTLTPPPAAPRSSVLRWTGTGASTSSVSAGVLSGAIVDADTRYAPLVLPGLAMCMSLWARTATATATVNGFILNRNGDGTLVTSTLVATAVALTTTWTRVVLPLTPAANSTVKYVLPSLLTTTAANPDIYLAAAQCEYGTLTPTGWLVGSRTPRVTFGESDGANHAAYWRKSNTYILAEN